MPRRKKRKSGGGRPSVLSRLSISELVAEFDRRRGRLGDLQSRRAQLHQELQSLDAEISDIESASMGSGQSNTGASTAPARRGRKPSGDSLSSVLHSLLKGRTMSIQQMVEAAKKSGYKSKSKDFRAVVSLALIKSRKMFKRVSRGHYTSK